MQRRQPGGHGPVRRPRDGARGARGSAGVRAVREGDRSLSRPAAARRAAAAGAAKRTTAPNPNGLTGRATVLLIVLAVLALGYAYPVRVYLTQLAEIDALQQSQLEQADRITGLERQAEKWKDDEYIKAQVRRRFFWVHPGQTPLVPVWDEHAADHDAGRQPTPPPQPTTWYGTVWSRLDPAAP
ncbi:FtsB family cell division protein [Catellatospora tritici]|uniref:FtsB family cell division protein n=1 Tax=Catellatospora tritici TaxID=2851566 RepID=UPI0027DFCA4D|nr:septum formation initiator family protein [Catellatospora tritici]